jgi:uncharacterized protein (TIGR02284 family)
MTTYTDHDVDSLNTLLRGELSAIESYGNAASRFEGQPQALTLRRICDEHRQAVEMLREHVIEHGGEPSTGSGPWGYFTAAITGTAKFIGPDATLTALRRGEEHGVQSYEDAIANDLLPDECVAAIVRHVLPRSRMHIQTLDRLIAVSIRDR